MWKIFRYPFSFPPPFKQPIFLLHSISIQSTSFNPTSKWFFKLWQYDFFLNSLWAAADSSLVISKSIIGWALSNTVIKKLVACESHSTSFCALLAFFCWSNCFKSEASLRQSKFVPRRIDSPMLICLSWWWLELAPTAGVESKWKWLLFS